MARWNVGSQARGFAFGIVAVATLFDALWVGLGNGLHKNYITPTPVCNVSDFLTASSNRWTLPGPVLVLDCSWVRS